MNALCLLALLLPPPDLESSFEGTVHDTNGNVVWLKVETRSTCGAGDVRLITKQVEATSETDGLTMNWEVERHTWSGPLTLCTCQYGARKFVIRDGFVSVFRGDTLLFRMYAPAYEGIFEE